MTQQSEAITTKFVQAYSELNKHNLSILEDLYDNDVVFEDPAHRMEGWDSLHQYFTRLFSAVTECDFDIHESVSQGDVAYLQWTMSFSHPRIDGGKQRKVRGCSRLEFANGRVIHHRDYFDMGEMIYEGVPILGALVRHLKASL
ncbi:nuclear transport factor 2 family protein [Photobacterium sanctipauli]|uniref:Nuclear transport factor 2 family protein n=1 Tax=Photobacterium sanctipauli TaxID=1342794 RepID=A0A2T3NV72_9GAMM|nr:nuclear transport factor 2 family protein [Photobacterium sanctipauli]PSW20180.1 nuclear transport factor 2 family protein [Photobacterium sanctipauli]